MSRTLLALAALVLWGLPSVLAQRVGPEHDILRNGDIIFQTSRSGQSEAIALATGSQWTHVGVLFQEKDEWLVLEAVGPVRMIALERWIAQGEAGRYALRRLDPAQGRLNAKAITAMRRSGEKYLGRPYDDLFLWENERIYCSELVWKVYSEGAGIRLCEPTILKEFALEHPVVRRTMQQRYGSAIPWNEPVVAPSALFSCPMLLTVTGAR